jgi:hypothetical protein
MGTQAGSGPADRAGRRSSQAINSVFDAMQKKEDICGFVGPLLQI